ncbi:MAG TPA: beta-N-acetylhexosaminidase, partial [Elusimicrobiales bacterium]|nr:beta-N-acetylhexosaminidase [Elusimicrobiales bacterium]
MLFSAYLLLSAILLAQSAEAQAPTTTSPPSPSTGQLSLQDRLGQVLFVSVDSSNAEARRAEIEKGLVGGVLLQWGDYSLAQTKTLVDKLQSWAAKSPSKIPLLIAADYEGGTVFTPTTLGLPNLPSNMMMGATGDEKNCAVLFYLAGQELKKSGIHISFAPVLDVNTNSKNPVIGVRSFGADPHLVGKLGTAVIKGLQAAGISAVAKHFPGHGAAHTDSHLALPLITLSDEELRTKHIKPFEDAIAAGSDGIMTAHVLYKNLDPKNPATFSEKIISKTLRGALGYTGVIFSDSLDMKGAAATAGSIEKAAKLALLAGVDVLLLGGGQPQKTAELLLPETSDKVVAARLEAASEAVLALKKKLGLFNSNPPDALQVDLAYQDTARAIAERSITLAWDKTALVPLPKSDASEKKPRLCGIFFSPPRFSYELLEINKPLMEAG